MGCRVYIGHLASRASERDVEHFFRGYGRIRDVVLKNGFGFVEFDDSRDAEDAVYELNGRDLMGERVIVELSRRAPRSGPRFGGGYGGPPPPRNFKSYKPHLSSRYGPPVQTRHRLVVENLSTRCSWQDLKDLMRHAGEVTYADAHKTERNTAVVCFATREDLKRAIEKYQGKDINGRKIKLVDDSQGGGRSYSRSHSRSRSPRSRSRSRSGGSRSRSRSRSPRSRSRSRSRSHSRSASRSRSPVANGKANGANSRSRSHTRSASRSRSRSRSGSNAD